MAHRSLARSTRRFQGPTAPRKRHVNTDTSLEGQKASPDDQRLGHHFLSDLNENSRLNAYESEVKGKFDRIVPLLKQISSIQYEQDFVLRAKKLALSELGFELPIHLLEKAWIRSLDMRALFAWCVFESHRHISNQFFNLDPLLGRGDSSNAKDFQSFLNDCGFHLLDITPCADGRLAHTIAYVLRIPFSSVRRRSHAGALFDIENTVNRWVKTEHLRYREGVPNSSHQPTRYLKIVTYHFSSLDSLNQGCAAHGSNDELAAEAGYQRLLHFREAIENSFCCGASVDLLLIGLDTDTDAIRVHVPDLESKMDLNKWISVSDIYQDTRHLSSEDAIELISQRVEESSPSRTEKGMVKFITRIITNNISQIDYVRQYHNGNYLDAGHAERFIGVGIGFKEVHLRNLTYFAHLETVEEGSPDLDVGIKIFKGLNVSKDLPIPVVVRFDYSGNVPGARERAIDDCKRVNNAISNRYKDLVQEGLLHTLLTVRDRDQKAPAEVVGSSLDPVLQGVH